MDALPFFATGGPSGDRRLLLISYHFPPSPASGGLRWQKLPWYARERGWGLDVVALDPWDLARRDARRLDDLPPGVRLYGVPEPRLAVDRVLDRLWWCWRGARGGSGGAAALGTPRAASRARREILRGRPERRDVVRAWYAWRDYARQADWARRAAAVALRVATPGAHRAVITCGPPHMTHEAGCRVAVATGLPLVIDLRDPWSVVQRLPESVASPVWYALAVRYERRVVAQTALIVMNTDPARRAMAAVYPEAADRIIAVMNGCDDEPPPVVEQRSRFVMAYAGSIYLDRDPTMLFRAAAQVIRETGAGPDEFGVAFMGAVTSHDGRSLVGLAEQCGISPYVRLYAPRPRHEALRFLAGAAMLVSLGQDSDLAIPAKVFEYLRFDAWLLALAEPGSATARLLRETAADVMAPDDFAGLCAVLRWRFAQFRRGERPRRAAVPARFSRRAQAEKLLDAMDAVIERPRSPGARADRARFEPCAVS